MISFSEVKPILACISRVKPAAEVKSENKVFLIIYSKQASNNTTLRAAIECSLISLILYYPYKCSLVLAIPWYVINFYAHSQFNAKLITKSQKLSNKLYSTKSPNNYSSTNSGGCGFLFTTNLPLQYIANSYTAYFVLLE